MHVLVSDGCPCAGGDQRFPALATRHESFCEHASRRAIGCHHDGMSVWLDRLWSRLRALFIPSVAAAALFELVGRDDAAESLKQLFDWERDRLFTLAKGLGASAAGVLATLVAAAFDKDATGTAVTVTLSAVLVALLLAWAAFLLTGLRRLAEQYTLALAVFA